MCSSNLLINPLATSSSQLLPTLSVTLLFPKNMTSPIWKILSSLLLPLRYVPTPLKFSLFKYTQCNSWSHDWVLSRYVALHHIRIFATQHAVAREVLLLLISLSTCALMIHPPLREARAERIVQLCWCKPNGKGEDIGLVSGEVKPLFLSRPAFQMQQL
jgi:hypothetical protein